MTNEISQLVKKEKISDDEFEFISEIIKIRLENKITQSELAHLTGISQPNITRFEKNIHSSSLSTVFKIIDALGYKLKLEKK